MEACELTISLGGLITMDNLVELNMKCTDDRKRTECHIAAGKIDLQYLLMIYQMIEN